MRRIQKFFEKVKFKYSPTIPDLDYDDKDSRKNWILYMAHKTGKIPVKEIYDKMQVSKVTVNSDFQELEKEGLIKREKEHAGTKNSISYVIPLFEDSGEEEKGDIERRRDYWLNFGLPILNVLLLIILIAMQLAK